MNIKKKTKKILNKGLIFYLLGVIFLYRLTDLEITRDEEERENRLEKERRKH